MFEFIRTVFALSLIPIAPFTWFGLRVTSLDVAATFRLVLVVRQMKEMLAEADAKRSLADKGTVKRSSSWEEPSFVKDLGVVLTVVYGGEAIASSWLGFQPSFMTSATFPLLYAAGQVIISSLPWVPPMSLKTELPLSILDGFTRAFLVCQLIPPAVTTHSNPMINASPWSLAISSLIVANGGFFLVGLFSMLEPGGFRLTTPNELRAWGWTTADLWCAPTMSCLFAYWTHAQPFWGDLHARMMGYRVVDENVLRLIAVDPTVAMSRCAAILAVLFTTRTIRNFGPYFEVMQRVEVTDEKKVQ